MGSTNTVELDFEKLQSRGVSGEFSPLRLDIMIKCESSSQTLKPFRMRQNMAAL